MIIESLEDRSVTTVGNIGIGVPFKVVSCNSPLYMKCSNGNTKSTFVVDLTTNKVLPSFENSLTAIIISAKIVIVN